MVLGRGAKAPWGTLTVGVRVLAWLSVLVGGGLWLGAMAVLVRRRPADQSVPRRLSLLTSAERTRTISVTLGASVVLIAAGFVALTR